MEGIIIKILAVVVTFGLVILFHEFGHFIAAKRVGVRVEKFSIGFGKELFGFTRGDTRYKVSAFPLGGYIKMAGEEFSEEAKEKGAPDEFISQKWWKRMIIILSGPLMNFVLGILI